jgi:PAS domain S-box-containing protein
MKSPLHHLKSSFGAMLFWVTLLATGIVVTLGIRFLAVRRIESENLARIQSGNLAQALDQNITSTLQRIDLALGSVVGELEETWTGGKPNQHGMERYLAMEGKLLPWPGIIWIADAQGRAIIGNRPISVVPPWESRWWFQYCKANRNAGMVVSKPIIGFLTKKWVISCVRRYNLPNGDFGGVVVIPLSVDYVQGLLSGYEVGTGGTLSLRDSEGGYIARYPRNPNGPELKIGDLNGSAQLTRFIQSGAEKETHFSESPYDHVPRIYANRRVKGAPLVIGVGLARADYLAQWRRDRNRTLAIMGISILGIWTFAWLFLQAWISQKRSSKSLSLSEERFRYVSSSMLDIAYSCVRRSSEDFAIDWMIGASQTLLGLTIEEIMATRCWRSLVLEEDRPLFMENVINLSPGESGFCELRLVKKDGSLVWFESFAQCEVTDKDKGYHRVFGALVDITKRKEAELAVQESEAKLNLVLNSTAEAIYGMDMAGNLTFFNEAFLRMAGYTRGDSLIGRNVHNLIHHSHVDGTSFPIETCHILMALEARQETHAEDEVFWRADGTPFPVEYWSWVQKVDEEVVGVVVTFIDITERKLAEVERKSLEAQLQHAQKMESLGTLAGGIAHDMNNVLGAILGLASANIEAQPPGSPTYRAFDTISRAAIRGGGMIKSLLGFARQSPAEERELDLNTILREEVHLLERTTLSMVRLEMDLAPDLKPIRGDASALTNAFMNLCVNSVHAMHESGTLTLRTRNVDLDWVEAMVKDTGIGMSKDVLDRALEPFFTTKEIGKGTGLGLSMVYSTVKAHHGQMDIQSEPGMGTTIRLRLPACEPSTQATNQEDGPLTGKYSRTLNVLLVDDDELIQSSMESILQTLGHAVITSPSGEEALAIIEAGFEPDVVILDMNMPGLGGSGTLPRLRVMLPNVPVLLSTGRADQLAVSLAEADPHVTLLPKPFGMKDLQRCLEPLGLG